ncbi:MAG TPA: archease [Thiohalobacter sp.]|nr:archease [Thiohalobacter sp.]
MTETDVTAVADWDHFQHGADIGIRGVGATPAEAFARAGVALSAVITRPETVQPRQSLSLACQAPDLDFLFLDWINALVYAMATEGLLFARYEVAIDNDRLQATAWGEPVDRTRHQPAVEVKGATLTALEVRQLGDGRWLAQCVVDV